MSTNSSLEVSQNVSNPLRTGVSQVTFMVNQYGTIVFDGVDEEVRAYDVMLQLLLEQPRYFLDNLDYLKSFQVSWLNYGSKDYCVRHKRNFAISHPKNV